uniref:Uncharacterized protein n=1 Tax=Cacopsylla melanoneura TaxID=428564 RepID=A0A8D8SQR1_9HEMI
MFHVYKLNILIVIMVGAIVMSGKRVLARIETEQILARVVPLHIITILTRTRVENENQKQNGKHTNDEEYQIGWQHREVIVVDSTEHKLLIVTRGTIADTVTPQFVLNTGIDLRTLVLAVGKQSHIPCLGCVCVVCQFGFRDLQPIDLRLVIG